MLNSTKTKRLGIGIAPLSIVAATILLAASLVSMGMMQMNAFAAPVTLFQRHDTENYAIASSSIQEGTIVTYATAGAFETESGDIEICVSISEYDTSIETFTSYFYGCGPADEATIANNLRSATYSASSITLVDSNTGEEMILEDVNVELTASGKIQRNGYVLHERDTFNNQIYLEQQNTVYYAASGSLNIVSEDFTLSTDDASGIISRAAEGGVLVLLN